MNHPKGFHSPGRQKGESIATVMVASLVLSIAMATAVTQFSTNSKTLRAQKANSSLGAAQALMEAKLYVYYQNAIHWFSGLPYACKKATRLLNGISCKTLPQPWDNSVDWAFLAPFGVTTSITIATPPLVAGATPPPMVNERVVWPVRDVTPTPPLAPGFDHYLNYVSLGQTNAFMTAHNKCKAASFTTGTPATTYVNLGHSANATLDFSGSRFYQCFLMDLSGSTRVLSDAQASYFLNRTGYFAAKGTPSTNIPTPNSNPNGNLYGEFTLFVADVILVDSASTGTLDPDVPCKHSALGGGAPYFDTTLGRAAKVSLTSFHVEGHRQGPNAVQIASQTSQFMVPYLAKPAVNCNVWSPGNLSDPLHLFVCGNAPSADVATSFTTAPISSTIAGCEL